MSDSLVGSPALSAVGYALVAFLWQGAAIAALTALALTLSRRAQATVRYAVACTGLALMAVAPVVSATQFALNVPAGAAPVSSEVVADVRALPAPVVAKSSPPVLSAQLRTRLEPHLPLIAVLWACGVGLGGIKLFAGWWRLRRLCRTAVIVSPAGWSASLRGMAERLGVTGPIQIVTSSLINVPLAFGWIRPAIVVPAALLASLPAEYLDAVLAHELAHIRRRDYLVNALQCVAEVLLFYHPAVWWVSQQVRVEREHCCDDDAANVCGDRLEYARAIASLEEFRTERVQLALAASGGHLLTRVRRLVEPSFVSGPKMSGGMMMVLTLSALLVYGSLHAGAANRVATAPSAPVPVAGAVTLPPATPIAPRVDHRTSARKSDARPRSIQVAAPQAAPLALGSISGKVIDPSGAVVPGVTVLVSSPLMSASRSLVTSGRGDFGIAGLTPGTYDLTLSLTGFKTARGQVNVLAGRGSSIRFRLELGSLEESVTINGIASGTQPPASVAPAPAADAPQLPIRVGGDIQEPKRVRDVKPVYPAAALGAGIGGTVIIEAVISKDGTVSGARVVQGVPELDEAALAAVNQWLYKPTMLNGQPVSVLVTATLTFVVR